MIQRISVLILLAAAEPGAGPFEQSPGRTEAPEYEVKAALLFNFLRFVEWPSKAFDKETSPFVIGILGEDPFTKEELLKAVQDKMVNKRKIEIRKPPHDLDKCHLLFIPKTENGRLTEVLKEFQGRPVLTVCETDGAAQQGATLNILIKDKKTILELNIQAVESAGLRVDSPLRVLCTQVNP